MENTALRRDGMTLAEMVREIIARGELRQEDQMLINELARQGAGEDDFIAIEHLTSLIQNGVIRVAS